MKTIARTKFVVLVMSCTPALARQYVISTVAGGGPPPTPVTAMNASIGFPNHVAVNLNDNVYFTSPGEVNCIFKLDPKGTLSRVGGMDDTAIRATEVSQ